MQYPLPTPIAANYNYEAVLIDDLQYDPIHHTYNAEVFGVTSGQVVPFIFGTREGLQRISSCTITDAEVDAVMAAHPEITDRVQAGLQRAMDRLYALINA